MIFHSRNDNAKKLTKFKFSTVPYIEGLTLADNIILLNCFPFTFISSSILCD